MSLTYQFHKKSTWILQNTMKQWFDDMDDSMFPPHQPRLDQAPLKNLDSTITLVEDPGSMTVSHNKRGHEELSETINNLCRPTSLLYLLSKGKSCSLVESINMAPGYSSEISTAPLSFQEALNIQQNSRILVKRNPSEQSKKDFLIEPPDSMEEKSQNTNQGSQYVCFVSYHFG